MQSIRNNIKQIESWFKGYSRRFLSFEDIRFPVQLKIDHIKRVVDEMEHLTEALALPSEDRLIARTVAWLHDTGRFPQVAKYKTMLDSQSENHATLGLRVLEEEKVISELPRPQQNWITTAIVNHNRYSIEDNLDTHTLLHCKLIRDADKIDIWNVIIKTDIYGTDDECDLIFLGLPEADTCSLEIIKDIETEHMARLDNMRTRNDFRLLVLSWIFDINFQPALETLVKRKYIDTYVKRLPDTSQIRRAIDIIEAYIKRTI